MNLPVKAAHSALLFKAARVELLKGVSPLATNVLAYVGDVEEGLTDKGSVGMMVPVWNLMDLVDDLLTLLEGATGRRVEDSEVPDPKGDFKASVAALVAALIQLSDWAEAKALAHRTLGDQRLEEPLVAIQDQAFTAAMGLEDAFLIESEEDDERPLLAEMMEIALLLGEGEGTSEEAFAEEQEIANQLIDQLRLAGLPKRKRATKKK